MNHQDWNNITLSNKQPTKLTNNIQTNIPKYESKLVAPSNLGQLIAQARTTVNKNRKTLASEIGISEQVLSKWETNKITPNNQDIAKIEKILHIKLPRCQKVKIEKD